MTDRLDQFSELDQGKQPDSGPSKQRNLGPRLAPADAPRIIRERAPIVAVIGDHILDGWWSGHSERMTREAPAPVIEITDRTYAPGGAANTAMNLAALGARVRSVGLIGDDEAGHRLKSLLADAGVDVTGLLPVKGTQTTTKYRILGGDQILVRIDDTHRVQWPLEALKAYAEAALKAGIGADAEVICDYGSTTFNGPLLDALRRRTAALTVVDAHDPTRWREIAPDLVTPNAMEVQELLGRPLSSDSDRAAVVESNSERILEASGATAAVVTLDRDGTVVIRDGHPAYRTWAHPVLEKQASGAGDTFVAGLTLARVAGFSVETSADFAQSAADLAVQKHGTSVCTNAELEQWLGRVPDVSLGESELADRVAEHRRAGRRVVFTNGCFDVLHRGHTSYLRQAKQLGDVLVVAVNGDDSVRRLKGPDRPINPATDRANVLAALSCVDHVTVFETDTPIPLIELLKPDVYTKGGDYTPEMLEETQSVRAYGGQVTILDYVPAQSTTGIVNRIRSSTSDSGERVVGQV